MLVVTYGTLKKNHSNNRLLSTSTFVTSGVVRGFELYESGFPVANISPDTNITVEVWDIGESKSVLSSLDQLEGYYENNPRVSMYHRIGVTVHGDDGATYEGQMYKGNPEFWDNFRGMYHCDYDENTKSYTWRR